MPYQQRKPRSFGADNTLACPNCSMPVSLTRRGPDCEYLLLGAEGVRVGLAVTGLSAFADVDGNPSELPPQLAVPQVSNWSFPPPVVASQQRNR
jgi:hypothetical protein